MDDTNTPSLNPNYGKDNDTDDGYDTSDGIKTNIENNSSTEDTAQIEKNASGKESESVLNTTIPDPKAIDTNSKKTLNTPNSSTPMNANFEKAVVQQSKINENEDKNNGLIKTIITVILIIIAWPIGIILMWVWTGWKKWLKLLITGIGCLAFLALFGTAILGFISSFINTSGSIEKAKELSGGINIINSKYDDSMARADSAELLNALERYYVTNKLYPWGKDISLTPPPNPGVPGQLVQSAHWLDQGSFSLLAKTEIKNEYTKRENLSRLYVFWDRKEDLIKVCFKPLSDDVVVAKYNNLGIITANGDYWCIPEEN